MAWDGSVPCAGWVWMPNSALPGKGLGGCYDEVHVISARRHGVQWSPTVPNTAHSGSFSGMAGQKEEFQRSLKSSSIVTFDVRTSIPSFAASLNSEDTASIILDRSHASVATLKNFVSDLGHSAQTTICLLSEHLLKHLLSLRICNLIALALQGSLPCFATSSIRTNRGI